MKAVLLIIVALFMLAVIAFLAGAGFNLLNILIPEKKGFWYVFFYIFNMILVYNYFKRGLNYFIVIMAYIWQK